MGLPRMFSIAGVVGLVAGATLAIAEPRIVRPEPDQVVHSNSGTVVLVVTGVPAGASLLPLGDGRAHGEPQPGPVVKLHGVDRGTHTREVLVIGGPADGARSPSVRFHLFHASRLLPQRSVR